MCNYVMNKVKFSSRGEEIIDSILTDEEVDFNKIVLQPKSLNLPSGSITDKAILYALSKKNNEEVEKIKNTLKNINVDFYGDYYKKFFISYSKKENLEEEAQEFDRKITEKGSLTPWEEVDYIGLGIKNFEDLGNMYINNIINYGNDTWYDWNIKNWGTKWNSMHTTIINGCEVEFETAWSCPLEIFRALSKQYPDVTIYVEYADEDIGSNCGKITLKNGKVEEHIEMYGNTDFALDVWGYDKEEWYEEIE